MADLKKKFIDILFEDDVDEQELQDDAYYAQKADKPSKNIEESPIKAKDILYRKSSSSTFINLTDPCINNDDDTFSVEDLKKDEYEMSTQISPIFGVIKENVKKTINVDPVITEAQTNKPSDAHLDIITSPIYGYATKEDAQDNNYDVKSAIGENEDEELHHLFDEQEESLNDSYDALDSNPLDEEEISLFRLFGENK